MIKSLKRQVFNFTQVIPSLLLTLIPLIALSVPSHLLCGPDAPTGRNRNTPPAGPPDRTVVVSSINYNMVYIPPGTFMMGSPAKEKGRNSDEQQHKVTLSKGFYMGTTEVTQGQWRNIMGNNPSAFKNCGDGCPVEQVSWSDVQDFIRRLNKREGTEKSKFRLPTEAEWEYACRAGCKMRFCFGDSDSGLGEYAWYWDNSENMTHPVAQKKPNAWGLYDMHGNVWEWCQDRYSAYETDNVTHSKMPSSVLTRVIRGGGWRYFAGFCRSADRFRSTLNVRFSGIGFRLARDL